MSHARRAHQLPPHPIARTLHSAGYTLGVHGETLTLARRGRPPWLLEVSADDVQELAWLFSRMTDAMHP